jgi:arylsulfatase A-like enzyme
MKLIPADTQRRISRRPAVIIGAAGVLIALVLAAIFFVFRPDSRDSGSTMPNIILLSIDTLRADHLGCYGYDRETSPNIDAFAADAVLFENAYSQAPFTAPAHMSLFTGLTPAVHRVANFDKTGLRKLDPRIVTFPAMLKERGWLTVGLHAGGMMSPEFGFDRGFDLYSEKLISYNWHRAYEDPKDLNVIRRLLETSRRDSRPLFLFLHHYVCHDPYMTAPESIRSRFLKNPVPGLSKGLPDDERNRILKGFEAAPGGNGLERLSGQRVLRSTFAKEFWKGVDLSRPDHRRHIVDLYDAGVYFADALFGKLLSILREDGSLDDSIIIVMSDHGEEFFEHGGKTHWQLFVETLHVPLIVKLPSRYAQSLQGRVARDVRTVDLFVTLFDLLGLPIDHQIQGESFLSLMKNNGRRYAPLVVSYDNALRSVRFIKDDFVYSDFMSHGVGEWLFSRPNDPAEQRNLAPSMGIVLETMRAIASDVRLGDSSFSASVGTSSARPTDKPSESLLRQLRALGYLE